MLIPRCYFGEEFCEFEHFFKKSDHKIVNFSAGDYICKPGTTLTESFYIQEGLARLSILYENGVEKIFAFYGQGGIFPLVCSEQNFSLEYSILLRAVTKVTAISFSPNTMKLMMMANSNLSIASVDHYCRFANLLLFGSLTQAFEDIFTRVCNILYLLVYHNPNKSTKIELSQEEIASIIGASRVPVARSFQILRQKEIIGTYRNGLIVKHPEQLKCYCSDYLQVV